jgi:hypothetical protein
MFHIQSEHLPLYQGRDSVAPVGAVSLKKEHAYFLVLRADCPGGSTVNGEL